MYERCLAIQEKALGPDHPDMAAPLNNWAVLLKIQVTTMLVEQRLEDPDRPRTEQFRSTSTRESFAPRKS